MGGARRLESRSIRLRSVHKRKVTDVSAGVQVVEGGTSLVPLRCQQERSGQNEPARQTSCRAPVHSLGSSHGDELSRAA